MGLTKQSTGISVASNVFNIEKNSDDDIVIALAGNPNTGKSTIFNSLTGLKQHTGNWPGKTVTNAQGYYNYNNQEYTVVDLPGTYSLLSNSLEEEIARDFICFGNPDVVVVVSDATCLERNLNLALQIIELKKEVVLCVNLIDEASRKKIKIDTNKLSELLGVPIVGTNAREGLGIEELKKCVEKTALGKVNINPIKVNYENYIEESINEIEEEIYKTLDKNINSYWLALHLLNENKSLEESIKKYNDIDNYEFDLLISKVENIRNNILKECNITKLELKDSIVSSIITKAESISKEVVKSQTKEMHSFDRKLDNVLTSRLFGIPIMIGLLGIIFWITIKGANYPSAVLSSMFNMLEGQLTLAFNYINAPDWLHGMLVLGMFRTLGWVISVMLPPMAIFFPIFTLMEDLGYLPRVAFNLDYYFKKACAHGKQALTMCMGFGCNAAGVVACRIIDSPRERLIAIITNNFVPCNGRFPTLIALATIFIAGTHGRFSSIKATLAILLAIVLGVYITLLISRLLSKTILKGMPTSFILELPPYRKPQVGKIIVRSIFDRTLFVLGRAVMIAAPAGIVIWVMQNVAINDISILSYCANFLNPFAQMIGLDGYILMAFILGLPANEIVIPILIMSYMSKGALIELESLTELRTLFVNNGWTWLTAVCTMLFSLNHFPCGTTLFTIYKETGSKKWTWYSFIIPTITGIIVCFIVAQTVRLLGF